MDKIEKTEEEREHYDRAFAEIIRIYSYVKDTPVDECKQKNKKKENKLFKATVIVKRRPTILDPQGKAVEQGARLLGFNNVRNTRIGKYIEFFVDTNNRADAEKEVNEYCTKLLANPVIEDFEYNLEEVSDD